VPSSGFEKIFSRLRDILRQQARSLIVTEDTSTRYCLEGRVGPATLKAWGGKTKRPTIPVAWVQIGKAYVSFHVMGAYAGSEVLGRVSGELQARMQGKTCFNFKVPDETLFQELESFTVRACQAFKKAGFIE
jgi:hypothetical protein